MNSSAKLLRLTSIIQRNYSSKSRISNHLVEKIAFSDDQQTIVAWHPKQEFPYEHTLPMPEIKEDHKSQIIKNASMGRSQIFDTKHPDLVRQELMKLTFTTKHRWYPRARDKRAKNTPPDREYL